MGEYQYYEFQAIDRALSEKEMAELRSYSTRAHITPTSFVNEYNWGNFKGDEDAWMERYFDAFLYLANWGSHVLKLRVPSSHLDLRRVRPYLTRDALSAYVKKGKMILTFLSQEEGGDDEYGEGEGLLAPLVSVRAELAQGDLTPLYLGWLFGLQADELDDDAVEPPVPPGLGKLTAPQRALAHFLRIDSDLLSIAAEASARLPAPTRRTVGEIRRAAEIRAEEKRKAAEREEASYRAKRLDALAGKEPCLWADVEILIAKPPRNYDAAVEVLLELRDLAARTRAGDFQPLLQALRARHARKSTLLKRLEKAGL